MADFRDDKQLSDLFDQMTGSGGTLDNQELSNELDSVLSETKFQNKSPFGEFRRPRPLTGLGAFKNEFNRNVAPIVPFLSPETVESAHFAQQGTGAGGFLGGVVGSVIPSALAILFPASAPVVFAAQAASASSQDFEETGSVASAVGVGVIEALTESLGVKFIGKIGVETAGQLGKAVIKKDVKAAKKIVDGILLDSGVGGGEEGAAVVLDAFNKVAVGVMTPEEGLQKIISETPIAIAGGAVGGALLSPISVLSPAARMRFSTETSARQAITSHIEGLSDMQRTIVAKDMDRILKQAESGEIQISEVQQDTARFIRSMVVEESSGTQAGLDEMRRAHRAERAESDILTDQDIESIDRVSFILNKDDKSPDRRLSDLVVTESDELRAQISEVSQFARQAITSTKRDAAANTRDRLNRLRDDFRLKQRNVKELNRELSVAVRSSNLPTASKNKILARLSSQVTTRSQFEKVIESIDQERIKVDRRQSQSDLKRTLSKAKKVKTEDADAKATLDSFVGMFDPAKPTQRTTRRLQGLRDFMEKNPDALIPQKVVDRLERLEQKPVSEMTKEEADDANEIISQIMNEIGRKTKIQTAFREADFEATVIDIESEIDAALTRRQELPDGRLSREAQDTYSKLIFGVEEVSSLDTMTEFLGGGEDSKTHAVLFENIDRDNQTKYDDYYKIKDLWEARIKGAGLDLNSNAIRSMSPEMATTNLFRSAVNRERITNATVTNFRLSDGNSVKMFRTNMIHLAAMLQDNQTRELVVLRGTPLVIQGQSSDRRFVITREDEVNLNRQLTTSEREIVRSYVEILNGPLRDMYREYSIKRFGSDKTQEGTWVSRHRRVDGKPAEEITAQNAVRLSDEQLSINKDRTEDTRHPIEVRDVFVEFENLVWTISSLRHMSFSIDSARRVIGDARIAKTIRESTRGTRAIRRLEAQYDAVVKSFVGRGRTPRTSADTVTRRAILNVNKSLLAFSPTVPFYQPVSVINASFEIPARFISQAISEGSPLNMSIDRRMLSESGAIRHRADGSIYQKLSAGVSGQGRRMLGVRAKGEKGLALIRIMDGMAIRTIWRSAELQARWEIRKGRLNENDFIDRVKSISQRTINRTQPTGDPLYSTGIVAQRGEGVSAAIFGAFRAQTSKTMDMIYREWIRAPSKQFGRTRAAANTLILTVGVGMVIAAIEDAVRLALSGFKPQAEEFSDVPKNIFKDGLKRATGIPLFGNFLWLVFSGIASVTSTKVLGIEDPFEGDRVFGPEFSPAGGTVADLALKVNQLGRAVSKEDETERLIDISTDMAALMASLKGIPIVVPMREIKKLNRNLRDQESSGRTVLE